jgi:uncharacterized membrane protein YeiH
VHPRSTSATATCVGVFVFAVSGALAAGRKQLDLLGVLVLATGHASRRHAARPAARSPSISWLVDPTYLT